MAEKDLENFTKYVKINNNDKNGKEIKSVIETDQAKIDEDWKYAGYNLLVTSELDMYPLQVYHTYHGLWKIEESFRITVLSGCAPVYTQKRNYLRAFFDLLP